MLIKIGKVTYRVANMSNEILKVNVTDFFDENGHIRDFSVVGDEIDSWSGGPGRQFGSEYELWKVGPKDATTDEVVAAEKAVESLNQQWLDMIDPEEWEGSGRRFGLQRFNDGYFLTYVEYGYDI
jgi:hypothetical protein